MTYTAQNTHGTKSIKIASTHLLSKLALSLKSFGVRLKIKDRLKITEL